MRNVVAYGDLESLVSSDFYGMIKGDIHLAESSNMGHMLKSRGYFQSVHLFREIISAIDPVWSKEKQRVRCLALISSCLRA